MQEVTHSNPTVITCYYSYFTCKHYAVCQIVHKRKNIIIFHMSYRLISEKTVEENILKKANEKRLLGNVAIEGGNFTTAFFKQVNGNAFVKL